MIFVDIGIILLLIVSITYCWQLNRKIGYLQNANNDFAFLTEHFNNSIKRADQTLANLKELSGETTLQLQNKIEKGNFVINDLEFMNDKATALADKLEKMMSESQSKQNEVENNNDSVEKVVKMPSPKVNNSDILKSLNNKSAIESLLKRMQHSKDEEQDNEGDTKAAAQKYTQYLNSLKKI